MQKQANRLPPQISSIALPDGKIQGFVSWNLCMENVMEGLLQGKWMLLDIEGADF